MILYCGKGQRILLRMSFNASLPRGTDSVNLEVINEKNIGFNTCFLILTFICHVILFTTQGNFAILWSW